MELHKGIELAVCLQVPVGTRTEERGAPHLVPMAKRRELLSNESLTRTTVQKGSKSENPAR